MLAARVLVIGGGADGLALAAIAKDAGFEVEVLEIAAEGSNGEVAAHVRAQVLARVTGQRYDAAIVELHGPHDVTAAVSAARAEWPVLPILVVGAPDDDAALAAGATDVAEHEPRAIARRLGLLVRAGSAACARDE